MHVKGNNRGGFFKEREKKMVYLEALVHIK
jgi:hypothetical protein